MSKQAHRDLTFRTVSRRVVARLFLARWFRLLARSALAVYPAAALLAVGLWYAGFPWIATLGAIAVVPAWLALTGAWAWCRRPSAEAALAYWDQNAGREEMFISAYCFESQDKVDAGEQLHLGRAAQRLQADLKDLPRDLPTPLARRAWALPLALVGLVGLLLVWFALVPPTPAEEPRIDEQAQARAQEVAQMLAAGIKLADKNQGLTPGEKEELKKLENSVEETAEKLRKLDRDTHRSVLAELEEKAHEAEKLAEALDTAADEELSSKMLEELARHADTTDFASAMQAKDLQKGSQEAMKLSKRLDHEALSLEEHKRIEHAFDKALDVATKADKQGLVGKHLNQAHQELQKEKPKAAANQLQRLSKQLAQAKQRQLAKQHLQQLAQQLRNSGQKIFGRKPSKVRRLTKNNQAGFKQLGAKQLQALGNIPLRQQPGAVPPGQLGRPTIGAQLAAGQNLPKALGQTPIPGMKPGLASGKSPAPGPGSGQPPIPGTGQCPNCGGQCQGQCQGQGQGPGQGQGQGQGSGLSPVPGTAMGQGAGDGGHFAGHGSAPYANKKTDPLKPAGTGVVGAAVSGEGPSQIRNVEQGMHGEDASRKSRQLAIEFIKTQEEALAEEPLPLSRRQQVLRYFTALRRRLVEPESPEQPNR